MPEITQSIVDADFSYVTTTGRVTGKPHTIEIWFSIKHRTLYILAGGRDRSDTIRNARKLPRVSVRINETHFEGTARVVDAATEEDALARRLLLAKYGGPGHDDLVEWGRDALPLAIDLDE